MRLKYHYVILTLALLLWAVSAKAEMTMDTYLEQVRSANGTFQGANQGRDGSNNRKAEADLVTATKLVGSANTKRDSSQSQNPQLRYDRLDTNTLSLGLQKTTTFGLDAKLSYDISSISYVNSNIGQMGGQTQIDTASPTITLTQSLWQNGFGRSTQANVAAKEAQAEADRYNNQYTMDSTIQNAIAAYWTLVMQKEITAIRKLAVEQAQTVLDYNSRRARMNLGEESDVLVARSSVETSKLNLQSALDTEEIALRSFNQFRNMAPETDPGALAVVNWKFLTDLPILQKKTDRSDVIYAKHQAIATAANSKILAENDKPILNVTGSYALNGNAANIGDALSNSYAAHRPTLTLGVSLSMPLDMSLQSDARQGAEQLAQAAQTTYNQKLRDQEADWADLNAKVKAAQKRITLAMTIEDAQKAKIELEKKRLKQGRTSTYQVLLYQQDYTSSQLTRVQTASEMINLLSRARLYNSLEKGISK